MAACTNGDASASAIDGPCDRPHPVGVALGGDDADLEQAVVGPRLLEDLDVADQLADVADQNRRRLAPEPADTVHLDLGAEGLGTHGLQARPDVGGAAEAILETAVGVADHRRVHAAPGHDREALAVEAANVDAAPLSVESDFDRLLDVGGHAEVRCEQIRRSGGDDGEGDVGAGGDVDAALEHAVASPDEDELGLCVEQAAHRLGRLAALRHLVPQRIGDSCPLEGAAQLQEPAVERLPRVRDDADLHGRSPANPVAAAPAARQASTRTHRLAIPITTPPATSSG